MYKAVINDNYLCHYNKNHSKANGQFVSGDGDGDGIANDHANQRKKNLSKIKGDISKGTWKNSAGVNLKFVSPKGLKSGYWIDADTGKKASAGNQWRQVPKEFRKREQGKALFWAGTIAVTAAVAQTAIELVDDYRSKKIMDNNMKAAQAARQHVDDMRRASVAKVVGGDW